MKSKDNKQRLFEMMNSVGGMPIKEFDITPEENQAEYQNLINFIGESKGYSNYLHTTQTVENAKSICETGLRFEIFQKTVDYVLTVIGLIYMLSIRKAYGNYTIIIQIRSSIKDVESISKKTQNEYGDEIFVLPPQYIKGYYNRTTKELFTNPLFKK
jgi:hypothetical protein